jgi:hypothetical protein
MNRVAFVFIERGARQPLARRCNHLQDLPVGLAPTPPGAVALGWREPGMGLGVVRRWYKPRMAAMARATAVTVVLGAAAFGLSGAAPHEP